MPGTMEVTMEERVMISNTEKLIVLAIRNEGAAFFKNHEVFIGATDILNGPDRTISKADSTKHAAMHGNVIYVKLGRFLGHEDAPKSLSKELREKYVIEAEDLPTGKENTIPLRMLAQLIVDLGLEFVE